MLFGRQSIDYDDAQVGTLVAELLGLPSVAVVVKIDDSGWKSCLPTGNRGGARNRGDEAAGRVPDAKGIERAALSVAQRNHGRQEQADRGKACRPAEARVVTMSMLKSHRQRTPAGLSEPTRVRSRNWSACCTKKQKSSRTRNRQRLLMNVLAFAEQRESEIQEIIV